MSENEVTPLDRLRWWLSTLETTRDTELDCEAVFELLEYAVEAARAGEDVVQVFPAIALHMDHCFECRDLFDTLVALAESETGPTQS